MTLFGVLPTITQSKEDKAQAEYTRMKNGTMKFDDH